jgi:hypothetical protein
MKQSKIKSLIEANANTFLGMGVSILCWIYVVPVFYPELKPFTGLSTALGVNLIFTAASIMRNYFVRRLFNFWVKK